MRDGQDVDRARLRSSLDVFVEMLEANLKLLVQRAPALAKGPTSALCARPPLLCGVPEPCEVVHARLVKFVATWHIIRRSLRAERSCAQSWGSGRRHVLTLFLWWQINDKSLNLQLLKPCGRGPGRRPAGRVLSRAHGGAGWPVAGRLDDRAGARQGVRHAVRRSGTLRASAYY